ncbi:MAG: glycosyltransferase [Rhodospirillaceae bacterium]|nr:glycosyltransferase [Rhodospirillaceae bacterium]
MGGPSELTDANTENPVGFWERRDVREICDRLLLAAGADWWKVARFEPEAISHAVVEEERAKFTKICSVLDGRGTWTIKEPRFCLLLPILRDAITNPICVLVFRNPLEVARSLRARNGFGTSAGIALWEMYNRHALSASKNLPRVLVSHENLMLRPAETLENLVERLATLGATDLETPSENRLRQVIEPSLYRRRASTEELPKFLSPSQLALWAAFRSGRALDLEDSASVSREALQHLFDLESAQLSLQRHGDRARQLRDSVATKNRMISDLRSRSAALTVEVNDRQATTRTQEATIVDLRRRIASLAVELDERQATTGALEATIATHVGTMEARQATIDAHEATIADLRRRVAALTLEVNAWQATTRAREAAIATHESTTEARQATIDAHEATIADLRRRIAALTVDLDERRAMMRAHAETIEAHEAIIRTRDDTIRELLSSTSWKATHPLRVVSRTSRRSLRALRRTLRVMRRLDRGPTLRSILSIRLALARSPAKIASREPTSPIEAPCLVSKLVRESRQRPSHATPPKFEILSGRKRLKISVIAWDLAHNPLGRAYLLADVLRNDYDVEIIGATFPTFGNDIWKPLRDCSRVIIKSVPGERFPEYFWTMDALAEHIDGDVIYVSKPRLPSLELAILAKLRINRPIILDIDDDELSFFGNREPLSLNELRTNRACLGVDVPYGEAWTRIGESLIPHFEHITVSNEELRKKYGGTILPHIRDEHDFDPTEYPREAIRRTLGFASEDKVILFAGTPRMHKGLARLVAALRELDRPNYKLLVVGSPADGDVGNVLRNVDPHRVTLLPDVPFADLPGYLCVADLVALLQDEKAPPSAFQIPAKFTDALSMGIPVLTGNAPPLLHLANDGLVELLQDATPARKIDEIFSNYQMRKECAEQNRRIFLRHYSYGANLPKLKKLIKRCANRPTAVPDAFHDLVEYHRTIFSAPNGSFKHAPKMHIMCNRRIARDSRKTTSPDRRIVRARRRSKRSYVDDKLDIVFFWKQNDTGVYGRRQDMFVKYLAQDPSVGRIFHFDAPVNLFRSTGLACKGASNHRYSHARLVGRQTLKRKLGLANRDKIRFDTFVYVTSGRVPRVLKRVIPSEHDYLDFLGRFFRRHKIGQRRTVLWVCPANSRFPLIEKRCGADLAVADVIDDERQWPVSDARREMLNRNYEDVLAQSDLVLTNCHSVLRSMRPFSQNIYLLPNAVELLEEESRSWPKPRELKRLAGPVIGYAGNLDVARIDLDLLRHVVGARPDWNFVFIGSMHKGEEIRVLERYGNVHFLGVRVYERALRYIRHFDAAIIPHLDNDLTRSMNPLKLYVYHALLVPVISTPIANMDDFSKFVRIGETPQEFVRAIEQCLRDNPILGDLSNLRALLRENSWRERVKCVLELIERELAKTPEGLSVVSRDSRCQAEATTLVHVRNAEVWSRSATTGSCAMRHNI